MKKEMRKFRFFLVLFILTLSVSTVCSQSKKDKQFKASFSRLLESEVMGNDINYSLFQEVFLSVAVEFVGEEKSQQIVDEYLEQQFLSDYVDVLLPYYKDSLSLGDINFLTEYCSTPEGKLAAQHAEVLNEKSSADMEELGANVMLSLMLDLPVDSVEVVDCPANYRKIYNLYYEKMSCEKYIEDAMESLEASLNAESGKADEKKSRMIKNYSEYMTKNYNELFLKCCYGVLTEDDMNFYINLVTTSAGQKYNNCTGKLTEDPEKLGLAIIKKFALWVDKQ